MNLVFSLFTVVVFAICTYWIHAYPGGAPNSACASMLAMHEPQFPRPTPAPYMVVTSSPTYSPEQHINVTVTASGTTFRGFLVEVRSSSEDNNATMYGTYISTSDAELICENKALTQTDPNPKANVTVTWIAPDSNSGHVYVRVTVVMDYSSYWIVQSSLMYEETPSRHRSTPNFSTPKTITMAASVKTTKPSGIATTPATSAKSSSPTPPVTSLKSSSITTPPVGSSKSSSTTTSPATSAKPPCTTPSVGSSKASSTTTSLATSAKSPSTTPQVGSSKSARTATSQVIFTKSSSTAPPGSTPKSSSTTPPGSSPNSSSTTTSPVGSSTSSSTITPPVRSTKSSSTTPHVTSAKSSSINTSPVSSSAVKTSSAKTPNMTQCGISMGCFLSPDCSGIDCAYMVTWVAKDDLVEFTISADVGTGDRKWIAIGFSSDMEMGEDSVIECHTFDGKIKVLESYNIEASNDLLANPRLGLSRQSASYVNSQFSCAFSRLKSVSQDAKIYDFGETWYLMFATGPLDENGVKMRHTSTAISKEKKNFLISSITTPPIGTSESTSAPNPLVSSANTPRVRPATSTSINTSHVTNTPLDSSSAKTPNMTQCGISMGCFLNPGCSGVDCAYLVTWLAKDDLVEFTISADVGTGGRKWIAIGFSSDLRMGGDSVIECHTFDGKTKVLESYNTGFRNDLLVNPRLGLSHESGSYVHSQFSCAFSRLKSVPQDPKIYNFSETWYLMFAMGILNDNGVKTRHKITAMSKDKINFLVFQKEGGFVEFTLVKLHGCVMVFAWILLVSVGIPVARHYKSVWVKKGIWIKIHRFVLIPALLLNIAGIVFIFVHVKAFRLVAFDDPRAAHPPLGIVVTILAILNPLMSIWRPAPDASKRPIFNWSHRCVGVVGHILAIINICLGVLMENAHLPGYALWIAIAFCGYIILINIAMEGTRASQSPNMKEAAITLKGLSSYGTSSYTAMPDSGNTQSKAITLKKFLFGFHILTSSGFAVALAVIIALA